MVKITVLIRIYLMIYLLNLASGMDEYDYEPANTDDGEMWANITLWPDLRCHEGYLKDHQEAKENGEAYFYLRSWLCIREGFTSPGCLKRCILEHLLVLAGDLFEFESEESMAFQLNDYHFPDHPETGKRLAKQILEGGCQSLLSTLANAETQPSCEDQEEFMDCVEKAMECK